ncbi:RNA-directed DNA polymerase, eukaryota, partial [Tanacetum coccineum]
CRKEIESLLILGANIFNSFINSTGLEEVHLGGSAFTWCHKSATKMSKLDRFFVSNNLLNIFPHISGITLDRFLSDHRPILLRESAHDYGPVPFRFFHHWIHLEGFNDFVTSTWNSAPSVDSNGMRNLAGKLKFLKAHIKIWIKDNKSETISTIINLKKELNQLDAVIDKGTGTEVEAKKRMEVLAALRNIDHIHSMDLAQKAKIKWSIEGDENSNFFHGILNKKRNQMNIRGITIDGVWKEQPNDVKQEFLSHFQDRFAKPSERRANIDMRFPKTISERSRSGPRARSLIWSLNGCWGLWHRQIPRPRLDGIGIWRSTGIFSAGPLPKTVIDEICLPNIGEETIWVKCVPIKIKRSCLKKQDRSLPTRIKHFSKRFRAGGIGSRKLELIWQNERSWLVSIRMDSKLKKMFEGVWYVRAHKALLDYQDEEFPIWDDVHSILPSSIPRTPSYASSSSSEFLEVICSEKFYCLFKDCSALLVDDGGEAVTSSECPHCNCLFCAQWAEPLCN